MREYIVAIEFGSTKVVGIAGYRNDNNQLVVAAIDSENTASNMMKRGCIQNVKDVYACVQRVKRKLENRISPAKIEKIYVGVGGVSVVADDKISVRTLPEDSMIKQVQIDKMKDDCRKTIPSSVDLLELVSVGYIVDGRAERNPIGVVGSNIEARYKAITAKPMLKRNIDHCIAELKLPIAGYITSALATAEVVLSNEDRMLGCMLIDMGAETTTVSIYKNNVLVLLETLPMGGRNITRDIMSLNFVHDTAEKLKIASGKAKGYNSENNIRLNLDNDSSVGIDLAKLSSVVEARSEEIVANIDEQIKRSGLERKDLVIGAVVVGGAARLEGMKSLLEERLNINVRTGVLSRDILVVEKLEAQVNDYVQAVGLLALAKDVCTISPVPVVEDVKDTDADSQGNREVVPSDNVTKPTELPDENEKKKKKWGWFDGMKKSVQKYTQKFDEMLEEGAKEDE